MSPSRHRWSFSLRRLFLFVTAIAIITGLARVSPGYVAVALFFALLSTVCVVFCWLMVRFERREYSAVSFCLPVAAVLAAMFAMVSMMLFVLSGAIAFTAAIGR